MASRRMISTRFFKDPDIMNLSSKETQLILIGLVLLADDEGREVAHAGLLAREMDYTIEQMEAALRELAANDLLMLYQVGKHRYYQLSCALRGWQTLGGRSTPSRYPAPPAAAFAADSASGSVETLAEAEAEAEKERSARSGGHGNDGEIVSDCLGQGNGGESAGKTRGNSRHFPDQLKLTESKSTETKLTEDEGGTARPDDDDDDDGDATDYLHQRADPAIGELTRQVACLLRLPVTGALSRLVAEYSPLAALSLPGEADAAREWIDDTRRNRHHRQMSPAFFRNWLKRELAAGERRNSAVVQEVQVAQQATGACGVPPFSASVPAPGRPLDLMHLADEDQQFACAKGVKC